MFGVGFVLGVLFAVLFYRLAFELGLGRKVSAKVNKIAKKMRPEIERRITAQVNYELLGDRPLQILPGDMVELDMTAIVKQMPDLEVYHSKLHNSVQEVDVVLVHLTIENILVTPEGRPLDLRMAVSPCDVRRTNRVKQLDKSSP